MLIVIGKKNHPLIYKRGIRLEVFSTDVNVARDWRIKIREYLENPNRQVLFRVKAQSHNFVLLEGNRTERDLTGYCSDAYPSHTT